MTSRTKRPVAAAADADEVVDAAAAQNFPEANTLGHVTAPPPKKPKNMAVKLHL